MANSKGPKVVRKPRPDFPLYPHLSRRWAKKVRGKTLYFGATAGDEDGQTALSEWLRQKDDLLAGRTPRPREGAGLTLRELCNEFLSSKRSALDQEKLSAHTFVDYHRVTDLLIESWGRDRLVSDLRPADFSTLHKKMAAKRGLGTIGREVTMVKSVFKYGEEMDLIERVKFGPDFKGPSKADKRKLRARKQRSSGKIMFAGDEIRRMLDAAGPQLKAMILLGINGGLGNTDCASLPLSAVDLDSGWLDYPRPKTGIDRRIPLWPETINALKAVIARRPKPRSPEYGGLVFLTRLGQPWVRYEVAEVKTEDGTTDIKGRGDDAIAKATANLLVDLGIYRARTTFYALRHTFETIAGGCRDQVAVDAVMGHVDGSMAAEYREGIDEERLKAVVNHVRGWLYPEPSKAKRPRKNLEKNSRLRVVSA